MSNDRQALLSQIPQVDRLLRAPRLAAWDTRLAGDARRRLAQERLEKVRADVTHGHACPAFEDLVDDLHGDFEDVCRGGLRHAINATGILLHTNLGRAPISRELLQRMAEELHGYCTLEVDEETGRRGQRTAHAERCLSLLTGCEASLVVNNNAAAVFLVLHALAQGKEVLISRGEIVQIGGGFRVPDILEASGARLVEVGTTNITTAADYAKHVTPSTALLMRVHQSNFALEGHVEEPSMEALKEVARNADIPLVVDLGSGSLSDRPGGEDSVQRALASGADIVCFSGDKLLGASQAGIVVGKRAWVDAIRKSPLYRALRLGKFDLYLLEQTLQGHLSLEHTATQKLLGIPLAELETRAQAFARTLREAQVECQVVVGEARIGGGTTPREVLETVLVEVPVPDVEQAAAKLCARAPALFVRKSKGKLSIDLRTVFPEEESALAKGIACLF